MKSMGSDEMQSQRSEELQHKALILINQRMQDSAYMCFLLLQSQIISNEDV